MVIDCLNAGGPAVLLAADERTAFILEAGVSSGDSVLVKVLDPVFDRNMRLIDSCLPLMIGGILSKIRGCGRLPICKIADELEKEDPLGLGSGLYRSILERFLCAMAYGMNPARAWDGKCDVACGCTVLTRTGSVRKFHAYNMEELAELLMQSAWVGCVSLALFEADGETEAKGFTQCVFALEVVVDA